MKDRDIRKLITNMKADFHELIPKVMQEHTADIESRLAKVEGTLKRKGQCLVCGFDHGVDEDYWKANHREHRAIYDRLLSPLMYVKTDTIPEHYCTCSTEIPCPVHDKNYQRIKAKLADPKPELECTCHSFFGEERSHLNPECPKHKPTPILPLHVKVAKVAGHRVHFTGSVWLCAKPPFHPMAGMIPIPDYPNDLTAAEQAATTYFNEHNLKWGVCHLRPPDDYYQAFYFVDFEKDRSNFICGDTAAEALSRLIVAHSEKK